MISSLEDLIRFLKHFHRHLLDNPGMDPSSIPVDLPAPLATLYRELGALIEIEQSRENDWCAPFRTQDSLLPIKQLKKIDGMFRFAVENQGNWDARCPVDQLDPPVYSNAADAWETEQRGHVVVCSSLIHFLTTLCLQEAVMGCRNLVALHTQDFQLESVTIALEPLWLKGRFVAADLDHDFYTSPDRDVMVMNYAGVWIGSPSRKVTELVAPEIKFQVIHSA